MKIPAILLAALVTWAVCGELGLEFSEAPSETIGQWIGAVLLVAFLVSLLMRFIRAGQIHFADEYLVVHTPMGYTALPYWQIESIRRRSRPGKADRLQVIYQTLGEQKVIELHPDNAAKIAAKLRERCPHLSSASDMVLKRNSGDRDAIQAPLPGRRRVDPSEAW